MTLPPRSSEELHLRDRLVERDEAALAELYDRFSSLVFGLALRVTGDQRAAEDVTQEVFLAIWERPLAFEPSQGSLRAWLGTLAHRRAVDWVRREEAARRRQVRVGAGSGPPDVGDTAVAGVLGEQVRKAVAGLPDDQQAAVRLAWFEGRTYRQVAEMLGIPEGTAKSRMRLGLQRIAGTLRAGGVEQWS